MGTTLTGTKPKDTYDSLIKVGDNGPIGATAKTLSDGLGNDLPISVSTSKVGIGTTSALGKLNIKNESAGATTNALALYNAPSNTENTGVAIEFYPNVGVDDRCARISAVNPTTSGQNVADLRFFTSNNAAPTEKLRILASGGITFNGDVAAANSLDDYEEGTWTPSLIFSGGSTGITYSVQAGKYVKVGSKVSVSCYVVLSNKGSSTGNARIDGLPFTIPNNSGNYSAISFYNDGNVSFVGQLQGFGNINGTSIPLGQVTEAGANSPLTEANFANNSAFMISLTYLVS